MITSVLQAKNLGFLRLYGYPIDSKLYVPYSAVFALTNRAQLGLMILPPMPFPCRGPFMFFFFISIIYA